MSFIEVLGSRPSTSAPRREEVFTKCCTTWDCLVNPSSLRDFVLSLTAFVTPAHKAAGGHRLPKAVPSGAFSDHGEVPRGVDKRDIAAYRKIDHLVACFPIRHQRGVTFFPTPRTD